MKRAYVTLITVIVLIPFLTLQGVLIIKSSINMLKASKIYSIKNDILVNKNNCFEEGLKYVKANPDFNGTKSIPMEESTCDVTVQELRIDPELGVIKSVRVEIIQDEYSKTFLRNVAVTGKNIDIIKE